MLACAIFAVLSTTCPMDTVSAGMEARPARFELVQREQRSDGSRRPMSPPRVGHDLKSTPGAGLIALAEQLLRKQLRKPNSAAFTKVSVKTASDGSTAVCGMIDSRNDTDGMTGPKPFVYDGHDVYVLIAGDGADNGTIRDGPFLDRAFRRGEETHSKFCR